MNTESRDKVPATEEDGNQYSSIQLVERLRTYELEYYG